MLPPSQRREEKCSSGSLSGAPGEWLPFLPAQVPAGRSPVPERLPMPLSRFNAMPVPENKALLLRCCDTVRWAACIARCRPYPDMDALLAALDEASYDMTPAELIEALGSEPAQPRIVGGDLSKADSAGERRGILAAHTALRAAHAAYEARFGFSFVICLDDWRPAERLDQAMAAVRIRLGHDAEKERPVAAEELRRLARARVVRLVEGSASVAR